MKVTETVYILIHGSTPDIDSRRRAVAICVIVNCVYQYIMDVSFYSFKNVQVRAVNGYLV